MDNPGPFYFKDCTLTAIATGIKAKTLVDLRDGIARVPLTSLYFHFWGGRLRPAFEYREYHSDFAQWAHRHLHDDILAERLDFLNPSEYPDLEKIRNDLIGLIDFRLSELDAIPSAKEIFHFVRSKIVVFSTPYKSDDPHKFPNILHHLPNSSLFFHFIDAARRTSGGRDDFSTWLGDFGIRYEELIDKLHAVDPYYISLPDLRLKLIDILGGHP